LPNKILAICDAEENYAYRLLEMLKARKGLPFDIHVFTEAGRLASFAAERKIECLLVAESSYNEEVGLLGIPHVFVLGESGAVADEPAPYYYVNKYQSADALAGAVMAQYIDAADSLPRKAGGAGTAVKIIGVYSPVKRCLQTTFAVTLGQVLAKQGKALYLNYENYSGFPQMLGRSCRGDITDMMYLFECVKEKFVFKLATITEQINGLDFVAPASVFPDLANIPGQQWTALLREMRAAGDYSYIILDLSDNVGGLFQILQECDRIYTITKNDIWAVAKQEQFEQLLGHMNYGDVLAKTYRLYLPVFKNLPPKLDEMTYGDLAVYIKEKLLPELAEQ
jgi:hypothetical protein